MVPSSDPSPLASSSPSTQLTDIVDDESACASYYASIVASGEMPYENCDAKGNCVEYIINGSCRESPEHTKKWKKYTVTCPIALTLKWNLGKRTSDFKMIPCYGASAPNPNNAMVSSDGVIHFSWGDPNNQGASIWFWPTVSDTEAPYIHSVGARVKLFTAPSGSYTPYVKPVP
jgi:hypothetical protein